VGSFVHAQQVGWVRKANAITIDNWRVDFKSLCNGNCLAPNLENIDRERNLILFGLADTFLKFSGEFYSINDNYKSSFILNNPIIFRERGSKLLLNKKFFTQVPEINLEILSTLKFSDVWGATGPVFLDTINQSLNLNLNLNTYMRLVHALSNFVRSLKNNRETVGTFINLDTFMKKPFKGSRPIRRILDHRKWALAKPENSISVKTFSRLTGLPVPGKKILGHVIASWNTFSIPNNLREFIFKFFTNSLAINTRLAHFAANVSRECTFCTLKGDVTDETFLHLFFECNTVRELQRKFCDEFLAELVNNNIDYKILMLTGTKENNSFNNFLFFSILVLQFKIWDFKIKKKIPTYYTFRMGVIDTIANIYKTCALMQQDRRDLNYKLCRDFEAIIQQYGSGQAI